MPARLPDRDRSSRVEGSVTEGAVVEWQEIVMVLSVLAPAERQRVEVAILGAALAASASGSTRSSSQWFDVVGEYVAFTIDEAALSVRPPAWWNAVLERAFT